MTQKNKTKNVHGAPLTYHNTIVSCFFAKVVFRDGKVYAQNRFVSTDAWDPDAPEGLGSAGATRAWTRRPGGWLKNVFKLPKNPLNTSVMLKGGKLYALCEGGKPAEMDPVTLETLGERDLGGIKVRSPCR